MASTETELEIDWMACELIEGVPGKVSGRPVVRGTLIFADAIAGSYELGESVEAIHEGFPTLSIEQLEWIIEFAQSQPWGTERVAFGWLPRLSAAQSG